MTTTPSLARVFIGSSSESRDVARHLQAELVGRCEVVRWDQNVFEPSGYTLDSLIAIADRVDFAVLVAAPDDTTVSRGVEASSARDNIVLEFGLFAGALGRERTFLLSTGDLRLPTDVLGLTRLPYHPQTDGNQRAALNDAALQIEQQIRRLGRRVPNNTQGGASTARAALDRELEILCANAMAQGWSVRTNNATTLRLRTPRGQTLTLAKGQPQRTRTELRDFVTQVRAAGLRVNTVIRLSVTESPF